MTEKVSRTEFTRAILVIAATIGMLIVNFMAATGRLGVSIETVSNTYRTPITPAGFAFSIWSLIYLGLLVFSIYQAVGNNLTYFRSFRSLYIFSCVLNCGWIFFWIRGRTGVALVVIALLWLTLLLLDLKSRNARSAGDHFAARVPFGLYLGWVTAAMIVNFAIFLTSIGSPISSTVGAILILIAGAAGVFFRVAFTDYLFPAGIAWAAIAIAVEQSVDTLVVVACAVTVVACLISAFSFIPKLPTQEDKLKTSDL
jgi:hypothetical protein